MHMEQKEAARRRRKRSNRGRTKQASTAEVPGHHEPVERAACLVKRTLLGWRSKTRGPYHNKRLSGLATGAPNGLQSEWCLS